MRILDSSKTSANISSCLRLRCNERHYGGLVVSWSACDLTVWGCEGGVGWLPPHRLASFTTRVARESSQLACLGQSSECQSWLGSGGGETCRMRVIPPATLALLLTLSLNTITGNNVPRDLVTGNNTAELTSWYCDLLSIPLLMISHRRSKQSQTGAGSFSPEDMTYDHRLGSPGPRHS